jgi:hypothetical protein
MSTGTCCLCGGPYIRHGNSPHPFAGGRACHDCDNRFVTPARMYRVSDPDVLHLLTEFARTGRFLVMATAKAQESIRALYGEDDEGGER